MKFSKNKVTGILLTVVGILYGWMSLQLKKPKDPMDPGSSMFPLIASVGLIICGIVVFATVTEADKKPFFTRQGWLNLLAVLLMLLVYVFGLKNVGFLIMTPLLLFGTSTMFSQGQQVGIGKRVLYSILMTAALYLFFIRIFKVALPMGVLPI